MNKIDLAYLAGVLDSDGCFTIKRTSDRARGKRGGECVNFQYIPRVLLKQVDTEAIDLMADLFGGKKRQESSKGPNFKPVWGYQASDARGIRVCEAVLPYLRIKPLRAACLLDLQRLKKTPGIYRIAWWFEKENPGWRSLPMMTTEEVRVALGMTDVANVTQALKNGTLIASRKGQCGSKPIPRFPRPLVELLVSSDRGTQRYLTPRQFLDAQEALYQKVRGMNKIGVHGTAVNHRTGHFAPIPFDPPLPK